MKIEIDGHKTTGGYKAATPLEGRKPVAAKWVVTYKTERDSPILKRQITCIAKGFRQVQDVDCIQAFAPTPPPALVKILAVVAEEHDPEIFHL